MTATARDIPGLVVDDSANRPPYQPRVTFERSAAAVREALRALNADDLAEFERDFHRTMAEAEDSFDLTPVHEVVGFWHGRALRHLNPEIGEYTAGVIERLGAGDESDLAGER
ncbi:DUF6247 family protein [Amycolatopsis panacis]|uniref:Uncharacterized protein n=1 Tax=Amycolatopsis panacis TaxID=2340917 RepID=A0A419I7A1_9PSEU|nr:DUF6247 family protein [Amycolatopsis panacis]RJQ87666.1 hypothetical protein D5S19_08960 [Amycolatopsis panacis]